MKQFCSITRLCRDLCSVQRWVRLNKPSVLSQSAEQGMGDPGVPTTADTAGGKPGAAAGCDRDGAVPGEPPAQPNGLWRAREVMEPSPWTPAGPVRRGPAQGR